MAGYVFGNEGRSNYNGLAKIFAYTNWDGNWSEVNCGQAAGATFLTFAGKFAPEPAAAKTIMSHLEEHYPPDNLFGYLGTSRRCVMRMCQSKGVPMNAVSGESDLRKHLQAGVPVIVMLGVSAGRWWKFDLPGGHWMVAYGFDDKNVYLTNWGTMTWDEFRRGWKGLVPRLINMSNVGLVPKDLLTD